jgi:hypothetical protein
MSFGVTAAGSAREVGRAFELYKPEGEFDQIARDNSGRDRFVALPQSDSVVDAPYHTFSGVIADERMLPLYARASLGSLGRFWWRAGEDAGPLWRLTEGDRGGRNEAIEAIQSSVAILQALNVEYVIAPKPGPPLLNRICDAGDALFEKYEIQHSVIYRNNVAMPLAYILHDVRVRGPEETLAHACSEPEFDPLRTVLVETSLDTADFAPGSPEETVRVHRYEDALVELELTVTAPGILVLTDSYCPGWTATFGAGERREIMRVNEFLRGVVVRPGDERVVFAYEPTEFELGKTLSTGAAVVWVALALILSIAWVIVWRLRVAAHRREDGTRG